MENPAQHGEIVKDTPVSDTDRAQAAENLVVDPSNMTSVVVSPHLAKDPTQPAVMSPPATDTTNPKTVTIVELVYKAVKQATDLSYQAIMLADRVAPLNKDVDMIASQHHKVTANDPAQCDIDPSKPTNTSPENIADTASAPDLRVAASMPGDNPEFQDSTKKTIKKAKKAARISQQAAKALRLALKASEVVESLAWQLSQHDVDPCQLSKTSEDLAFSKTSEDVAGSKTSEDVAGSKTSEDVAGSKASEDLVGSKTSEDVDGSKTSEVLAGTISGEMSALFDLNLPKLRNAVMFAQKAAELAIKVCEVSFRPGGAVAGEVSRLAKDYAELTNWTY